MLCVKCGNKLRHRVISNTYWCPNTDCSDYKGRPPIKVDWKPNLELNQAMSPETWARVDKEIKIEDGD